MTMDTGRKLALFASFILLAMSLLTILPDFFYPESESCHSCHEQSMPLDHLFYRENFLGYNSLCSFAPFSTILLLLTGVAILLTTFKFKLEKWGTEYRKIGSSICFILAIVTVFPMDTGYDGILGWKIISPSAPISTAIFIILGLFAYFGYMVCPFMIIWRCKCPVLEKYMDIDRSPHRAVYRFIKMALTGNLSRTDMERLYRCTLCNCCWLASFNHMTRKMAVKKGYIADNLEMIKSSIKKTGNPYGIVTALKDGSGHDMYSDTLLFIGCTARYRTPQIIEATEKLLKEKGIKYKVMADETCCGYTLYNPGDTGSANEAIDNNIKKFNSAGIKHIITICPGRYSSFNKLYRGRPGFNSKVSLGIDLFKDALIKGDGFIVHDPCHAKEKSETTHKILKGSREEGTGGCCDAGAGVMSCDRLLAGSRARRIFEENKGTIITYCPLCYLNLSRNGEGNVKDLYMLMALQED
jgi:Fe-S oxidoreductase